MKVLVEAKFFCGLPAERALQVLQVDVAADLPEHPRVIEAQVGTARDPGEQMLQPEERVVSNAEALNFFGLEILLVLHDPPGSINDPLLQRGAPILHDWYIVSPVKSPQNRPPDGVGLNYARNCALLLHCWTCWLVHAVGVLRVLGNGLTPWSFFTTLELRKNTPIW